MKVIILILIFSTSILASDAEFLRRPPISSKCQSMLDKKEELDDAVHQSKYLIQRSERLGRSVKYDRKASQARVNGIKARIEIKRDHYQKKRSKHLEALVREGCPTFQ